MVSFDDPTMVLSWKRLLKNTLYSVRLEADIACDMAASKSALFLPSSASFFLL